VGKIPIGFCLAAGLENKLKSEFTEVVTMSSSSDDDIGLDVYKPDSAREPQLLGQ